MAIKTERGRVVYDRKTHNFGTKDVVRILEALDLADYTGDFGRFGALLEIYFQAWGMIIEGLFILAPREPEKTGALLLKIVGEYSKMLVRLLKKLPFKYMVAVVNAFRIAFVGEEKE
ncbi:hypothetical protein ES708_28001 [subsurface metagenome]